MYMWEITKNKQILAMGSEDVSVVMFLVKHEN